MNDNAMKLLIILSLLLSGCASTKEYLGKPAPFAELKMVHHIQPWMDEMLKDQRHEYEYAGGYRWMGNNPRIHLELGLEWEHKIDCPVLVTGTSLFVGAPLKSNGPEVYWVHLECGKRWGGK